METKTLEVFDKLLTLQTKTHLGVEFKSTPYDSNRIDITIYKDESRQSDILFDDFMYYGKDEEFVLSVLNDFIRDYVK